MNVSSWLKLIFTVKFSGNVNIKIDERIQTPLIVPTFKYSTMHLFRYYIAICRPTVRQYILFWHNVNIKTRNSGNLAFNKRISHGIALGIRWTNSAKSRSFEATKKNVVILHMNFHWIGATENKNENQHANANVSTEQCDKEKRNEMNRREKDEKEERTGMGREVVNGKMK